MPARFVYVMLAGITFKRSHQVLKLLFVLREWYDEFHKCMCYTVLDDSGSIFEFWDEDPLILVKFNAC